MPVAPRPSIFQFPSFGSFLATYVRDRKAADPAYSYRRLSRRLGRSSESLVRMVAIGKRRPSPELVHQIGRAVGFTAGELEYAETLVALERARAPHEKSRLADRLRMLSPSGAPVFLDLDQFAVVSSWHHIAILEMFNLRGFRADAAWISRRLGGKADPHAVKSALLRLERLGLIRRKGPASFERVSRSVRTPQNLPSRAIRDFHRGMIGEALASVEAQTVSERVLGGMTMTIDVSKLPAVHQLIQDFQQKVVRLAQADPGDETYQLNVQFFRLTAPERREGESS